jgi:hypothetical protein
MERDPSLFGGSKIFLVMVRSPLFSPIGLATLSVGILSVEGDLHKKQASIQLMSIVYALISVL